MNPAPSSLCKRFLSSVSRVVDISDFSCAPEGEKTVIRGSVESRDDATMCGAIARLVPGGQNLVIKLTVDSNA